MVFFGSIMMILFWGTIIGLIVWGARAATSREQRLEGASSPPSGKRASDIVKECYARAEIDRDEFDRIMNALEYHPPPTKVHV